MYFHFIGTMYVSFLSIRRELEKYCDFENQFNWFQTSFNQR